MADPSARSDEEIQRDVLDQLRWDARVQPHEIAVTVRGGVVTLLGWVDSYGKKWAAERAAHRVRGVAAVANDIDVRLPRTAQRTDADIAAAAVRALAGDAFVPVERLDVTVANGWLTLKGEVEWEFQRRAAEGAVRRLSGIRGLANLIEVRPRINPSPTELRNQLAHALARSAEPDSHEITVETDGSTVVLRGTVRSWSAREEAERISWSAPGVTAVDNRITVDPG
ncbi:MAG: ornithine aminotransferase [Actinobacteria bacterium]|jgi:osmotically-inducible protein OsmY|nr:MAG: ornithine aminotransferase [Actinomycetota bacterium]